MLSRAHALPIVVGCAAGATHRPLLLTRQTRVDRKTALPLLSRWPARVIHLTSRCTTHAHGTVEAEDRHVAALQKYIAQAAVHRTVRVQDLRLLDSKVLTVLADQTSFDHYRLYHATQKEMIDWGVPEKAAKVLKTLFSTTGVYDIFEWEHRFMAELQQVIDRAAVYRKLPLRLLDSNVLSVLAKQYRKGHYRLYHATQKKMMEWGVPEEDAKVLKTLFPKAGVTVQIQYPKADEYRGLWHDWCEDTEFHSETEFRHWLDQFGISHLQPARGESSTEVRTFSELQPGKCYEAVLHPNTWNRTFESNGITVEIMRPHIPADKHHMVWMDSAKATEFKTSADFDAWMTGHGYESLVDAETGARVYWFGQLEVGSVYRAVLHCEYCDLYLVTAFVEFPRLDVKGEVIYDWSVMVEFDKQQCIHSLLDSWDFSHLEDTKTGVPVRNFRQLVFNRTYRLIPWPTANLLAQNS